MKSPRYLTVAEVVERYPWPTAAAFRQFLYRRRQAGFPIPTRRVGRKLCFCEADLEAVVAVVEGDASLTGQMAPKRRTA